MQELLLLLKVEVLIQFEEKLCDQHEQFKHKQNKKHQLCSMKNETKRKNIIGEPNLTNERSGRSVVFKH